MISLRVVWTAKDEHSVESRPLGICSSRSPFLNGYLLVDDQARENMVFLRLTVFAVRIHC